MGVWEQAIEDKLPTVKLEAARRLDSQMLAPILDGPMQRAQFVRRVLVGLDQQDPDELPDGVSSRIEPMLKELTVLVDQAAALDGTVAQSSDLAHSVARQLVELDREARVLRRDIRAGDLGTTVAMHDLEVTRAGLVELTEQTRDVAGRADSLLARVETLAGQVGAGKLEVFYEAAAKQYRERAGKALWATIGLALIFAVAAYVVFGPLLTVSGDTPWQELLRDFTIRAALLSIIAYGLSIAVRNYRANAHMAAVAEHKQAALRTYILFQEGEGAGEAVTSELVRFVFSSTETGMLTASGDRTVIEQTRDLIPISFKP